MTDHAFCKLRLKCPMLYAFAAQYETLARMHAETYRQWKEAYYKTKPLSDKLADIEDAQKALDAEFKNDFGYSLADVKHYIDAAQ